MTLSATTTPPSRDDLACPLCGYSLRGLVDPRCPECGYSFEWEEILDTRRWHHPYLFEHGRRRNIVTFLKTVFHGQRPSRFWSDLNPAMPVHWFRLVLCWMLVNTAFSMLLVVPPVWVIGRITYNNYEYRSHLTPVPGSPGWFRDGHDLVSQGELDQWCPSPWQIKFYYDEHDYFGKAEFFDRDMNQWCDRTRYSLVGLPVVLAWPWISLAAAMIFQASMRRAKIKLRHVLRAVIYSCDFALPVVLVTALIGMKTEWHPLNGWVVVLMLLGCAGLSTFKLFFAFDRYLQVHRPIATVIAVQTVTVMVMFVVTISTTDYGTTLFLYGR